MQRDHFRPTQGREFLQTFLCFDDDITTRVNLGSTEAESHLRSIAVVFLDFSTMFRKTDEKWTDHHLDNGSAKKIVNVDGHVCSFRFRVFLRKRSEQVLRHVKEQLHR